MDFRREPLIARFRSPSGAEELERRVEVRFDPLLGTSARVAEGVKLPKAEPGALEFLRQPDPDCPFCPERLERLTPRLPREVCADGRIRRGETVLFPNLVPYSQYAAVAIFDARHWLALSDFAPALIADNLAATQDFVRAVQGFDSQVRHCAYNVNYLYPSGGSLPHPHAQVYLDRHPTTMARFLGEAGEQYRAQHGRPFWDALVEAEEARAERFVGRIGATSWMTAFAPLGFNEVRAVIAGRATLLDLTADDLGALALGISRVLAWYEASRCDSFNLALYSGPLGEASGFRVNLVMMTRSALAPHYRSDAMYLERLHWEAAVDRAPEALAAELRARFAAA